MNKECKVCTSLFQAIGNKKFCSEVCRQVVFAERNSRQKLKVSSLYVDHDHKTGKVRGLLCGHCNAALGLMGDSVAILRAAIDYLENHYQNTTIRH